MFATRTGSRFSDPPSLLVREPRDDVGDGRVACHRPPEAVLTVIIVGAILLANSQRAKSDQMNLPSNSRLFHLMVLSHASSIDV